MGVQLEIKNLNKSFLKGNEKFPVLENINFNIMKGEIFSILGPSGCGKSTLLRQIAELDTPDTGEIILNTDKSSIKNPNRILVFQDFNQLFPWKTVLENVIFPLKFNKIGTTHEERKRIAEKYLSMVKLEGFDHHYPYQLSGGMKQKAAIARALALNPEVLLMDEPFASLDAQTRSVLQNTLLEIWKDTGVTIVFVTHDIQEAILISNRIMILCKNDNKIKDMISNTMKRPRRPSDPQFIKMWEKIYDLLET